MSNWPFWMVFIIMLGITTAVTFSMGNFFITQAVEIPKNVEEELILAPRFYNSEKCFAYIDGVGRVHTKVIDLDKFKQENMDKCYPESNVKYAFSLSLEAPEINLNVGPITTFNWIEGFVSKEVIEDVFVLYNGVKIKANLKVGIKNVK